MELETIAASALVSAAVSWVVASRLTVRQERAKRREAGLIALRQAVRPLQDKLSSYRFRTRREVTEREPGGSIHLGDLEDLIRIRRAAEPMAPWRRWLIDRRLRAIYGNALVDLTRDYPSARESASEASFTTWMAAAMHEYDAKEHPTSALLHRTYADVASKGKGKALARELKWLARGM